MPQIPLKSAPKLNTNVAPKQSPLNNKLNNPNPGSGFNSGQKGYLKNNNSVSLAENKQFQNRNTGNQPINNEKPRGKNEKTKQEIRSEAFQNIKNGNIEGLAGNALEYLKLGEIKGLIVAIVIALYSLQMPLILIPGINLIAITIPSVIIIALCLMDDRFVNIMYRFIEYVALFILAFFGITEAYESANTASGGKLQSTQHAVKAKLGITSQVILILLLIIQLFVVILTIFFLYIMVCGMTGFEGEACKGAYEVFKAGFYELFKSVMPGFVKYFVGG